LDGKAEGNLVSEDVQIRWGKQEAAVLPRLILDRKTGAVVAAASCNKLAPGCVASTWPFRVAHGCRGCGGSLILNAATSPQVHC